MKYNDYYYLVMVYKFFFKIQKLKLYKTDKYKLSGKNYFIF